MTGMGRSWRRLQRELTPGAPSVGALNGWRRYARPAALVLVAALVGAGLVLAFGGSGDDSSRPTVRESFVASDSRVISVLATSRGCRTSSPRYPSGKLLVQVANRNATGLGTVALLEDGLPVGEREAIPPGSSGSFAITLQPGRYTLRCMGTRPPDTTLTITGSRVAGAGPDTSKLLLRAADRYSAYLVGEAAQVVKYLQQLGSDARRGRVVRAQCDYGHARQHLDHFSEVAGVGVAGGDDLEDGWTDLARILFARHTTAGVSARVTQLLATAHGLASNVAKLPIASSNVALAAENELQEVASSETFGEAEPYSHGDLLDIAGFVQGSQAAFTALRPALTNVDAGFTTNIASAFASCNALLNKLRDHSESGYVDYNRLGTATHKRVLHAITAIAQPAAYIPQKLVHQ